MTLAKVVIDVHEKFAPLSHAPIVEAVIDFRAQTRARWVPEPLKAQLKNLLPGYEFMDFQRAYEHKVEVKAGCPPEQQLVDLGFKGIRFRSEDQLNIVAFNQNGYTFSRLAPYESWEQFEREALRLWGVHLEIAQVTEIDRIGLRYINRLTLEGITSDFADYIDPHPDAPRGLELPYVEYFQQDILDVPGYPYVIRIIRNIQPSADPASIAGGLILDLDVFTKSVPTELDSQIIEKRLCEMRWLKNKAFLGSISERKLEALKGEGT